MVYPSKHPNVNAQPTSHDPQQGLLSWLTTLESSPAWEENKAAASNLAAAFARMMNIPRGTVRCANGVGRVNGVPNQTVNGLVRGKIGEGERLVSRGMGKRKSEIEYRQMPKSAKPPMKKKGPRTYNYLPFKQVQPHTEVVGPNKYNTPIFTSISPATPPFIPSFTTSLTQSTASDFSLPVSFTSSTSTSATTTPPSTPLCPSYSPLPGLIWLITSTLTRTHLTHILKRLTSELDWDFITKNFSKLFPNNAPAAQAWETYHLPLYMTFLTHVASRTTYDFIWVFGGEEYKALERFKRFVHDLMCVFSDVKGRFGEEVKSEEDRATLDRFLRTALNGQGMF
jgi:hypothetical protein